MRRVVSVRSFAGGVLFAAVASAPTTTLAASAEDFLNAPVWYLQYEVTFTSKHQGSYDVNNGTFSFTTSMERVFSDSEKLNLRSQGPGPLSMQAMTGSATGSMSPADAQKMSMTMMSQMEYTANWLVGGAGLEENATDEEIAADSKPSSPVRLDYTRVDTGTDFVDDGGQKYDRKATKTVKGTGKVLAGGLGVTILEMDTSENSYVLQLPFVFNDMGAYAKSETIDFMQEKGKPGTETRSTEDVRFDLFPPDLALDEEQPGAAPGGVLVRGKLDPSTGRIAGEQSFKAHYKEGNDTAPGTLVFKFTLTMTPPKD